MRSSQVRADAAEPPSMPISPFARLRALLADHAPGGEALDLALGEPRVPVPGWLDVAIGRSGAEFGRYPTIRGSIELRTAIADWIGRTAAPAVAVDPEREVLPCCGSREGLFLAVLYAVRRARNMVQPAVLFPDPSYPAYAAAAIGAGAEPVPLPAPAANGFLPDLDALAERGTLLDRAAAMIIGTPANPQGAVADPGYLTRAAMLARAHDMLLICDECYGDVFTADRPPSALAACGGVEGLLVFNSLSKRSGLPGLRSGFCAGDAEVIAALAELRNVVGPQMPGPLQHASALAWADEAHVEAARDLHRRRMALAADRLGGQPGFAVPQGGFFLWLDVTPWSGIDFAAATWRRLGIRVLPGVFMAREPAAEVDRFVRVALVHDLATLDRAFRAIEMLLDALPARSDR